MSRLKRSPLWKIIRPVASAVKQSLYLNGAKTKAKKTDSPQSARSATPHKWLNGEKKIPKNKSVVVESSLPSLGTEKTLGVKSVTGIIGNSRKSHAGFTTKRPQISKGKPQKIGAKITKSSLMLNGVKLERIEPLFERRNTRRPKY